MKHINPDRPYLDDNNHMKNKTPQDVIKSPMEQLLHEYKQEYLNAKMQNKLPTKVFFTNTSKMTTGKLGRGYYTKGKVIDLNVENPPNNELSLDVGFIYSGNITSKKDVLDIQLNDYRAIKLKDDLYFIFNDTFEIEDNLPSNITKKGNRYFVDGDDKPYRNPKRAMNAMRKNDATSLNNV